MGGHGAPLRSPSRGRRPGRRATTERDDTPNCLTVRVIAAAMSAPCPLCGEISTAVKGVREQFVRDVHHGVRAVAFMMSKGTAARAGWDDLAMQPGERPRLNRNSYVPGFTVEPDSTYLDQYFADDIPAGDLQRFVDPSMLDAVRAELPPGASFDVRDVDVSRGANGPDVGGAPPQI